MRLAREVRGKEEQRPFRARLHTFGVAAAQVAFERRIDILVREDAPERTRDNALVTSDTLLTIDLDDTILMGDCVGRAVLAAFRHAALVADDGHPDNGMRVRYHNTNGAFLGVVHAEMFDSAHELAQAAPRTSFRNYRQSLVHSKVPYSNEKPETGSHRLFFMSIV